jgi:hypothetical protein
MTEYWDGCANEQDTGGHKNAHNHTTDHPQILRHNTVKSGTALSLRPAEDGVWQRNFQLLEA